MASTSAASAATTVFSRKRATPFHKLERVSNYHDTGVEVRICTTTTGGKFGLDWEEFEWL
jgi:hypothetical protein